MQLRGKKILLGITASIAAYKAVELCRLLVKEGADVRVIMTPSASGFITPLTLSVVSKNPVSINMVNEQGLWNNHVELGLWADLFIIAPCTANTMAKMAFGFCDNLLTAVYLSARCPVMIAPAMDHDMFLHPATQQNIISLKNRTHIIIGPAKGELASGLIGEGRIEEPDFILQNIISHFNHSLQLRGKKVLITAGPTQESIDPVRFISNHSSGKMGFAIAEELVKKGAEVTLVAGPNNLDKPGNLHYIAVESASQMYDACLKYYHQSDISIMSAAVADFKPEQIASQKIKKANSVSEIKLIPTLDILAEMGNKKQKGQLLIGFALETNNALAYAKDKLVQKNLDLIVMNTLEDSGAGFKTDFNKVTLIDRNNTVQQFDLKSKKEVAVDIVNKIIELSHA